MTDTNSKPMAQAIARALMSGHAMMTEAEQQEWREKLASYIGPRIERKRKLERLGVPND